MPGCAWIAMVVVGVRRQRLGQRQRQPEWHTNGPLTSLASLRRPVSTALLPEAAAAAPLPLPECPSPELAELPAAAPYVAPLLCGAGVCMASSPPAGAPSCPRAFTRNLRGAEQHMCAASSVCGRMMQGKPALFASAPPPSPAPSRTTPPQIPKHKPMTNAPAHSLSQLVTSQHRSRPRRLISSARSPRPAVSVSVASTNTALAGSGSSRSNDSNHE